MRLSAISPYLMPLLVLVILFCAWLLRDLVVGDLGGACAVPASEAPAAGGDVPVESHADGEVPGSRSMGVRECAPSPWRDTEDMRAFGCPSGASLSECAQIPVERKPRDPDGQWRAHRRPNYYGWGTCCGYSYGEPFYARAVDYGGHPLRRQRKSGRGRDPDEVADVPNVLFETPSEVPDLPGFAI